MPEVGPNGQPLLASNPADEPEACRWCGLPSDMVVPVIEPAEVQALKKPRMATGENIALCDNCQDERHDGTEWRTDLVEEAFINISEELEIDITIAPELRGRMIVEKIKRMREDIQEARMR